MGTSTTKIVITGEAGDTTYYKSSFGDFDDPAAQAALLAATFEQNKNEMREGAEGNDLKMQDVDDDGRTAMSSLALHQNEKDLLALVRQDFDKVIVLLNSAYQMEVHEILPYCDALMFIGTPGHQGFVGVAEILRGTVNPSGHLVDTLWPPTPCPPPLR